MNKDVIYIEPEDDITDIITKIENAKEKIIALVPPKKAGVFRSVVNIKLISKAGASAEKTIVLVTTDPSIVKLAAATKLPVTKDLQSAPSVPNAETIVEETTKEDVVEEVDTDEEVVEEDETAETAENSEEADNEDEEEKEEEELKKEEKEAPKKQPKTKKDSSDKTWFGKHKKLLIFGSVGMVALILVLVWALVIAPAATVNVAINTETNNFSEGITFTTKLEDENAEEGKFYLDEKKIETVNEVFFEATGSKNIGERATGEVVIYAYFRPNEAIALNAGTTFSINGLSYVSDKDVTLSWDGSDVCENRSQADLILSGCLISGRVTVKAAQPGSKYNIAPSSTGWNTTASVAVYSDKAMTGGTDNVIRVVQQSDVEKARASLASSDEDANKEKLYNSLKEEENVIILDSSFKQTATAAVSTPAVDEEVKEGVKPSLKATTVTSVVVVDKTKIDEYIKAKAKLGERQKIYKIENQFIESFVETDKGYTGKLKALYVVGPEISEKEVLETVKGRGLGDAQHALKEIDGISEVTINTSFPWVTSIPNDSNKVTINISEKSQE